MLVLYLGQVGAQVVENLAQKVEEVVRAGTRSPFHGR